MVLGNLERVENGQIHGWIYCQGEEVLPYVTVDGEPCSLIDAGISRPDVNESLKINEKTGFLVSIDGNYAFGNHEVELHAIAESTTKVVCKKEFNFGHTLYNLNNCTQLLQRLSSQENSTAIVVWEGTHNPIGRAKVLYDIVSKSQETVIFAFSFNFSPNVWSPLIDAGTNIVLLPWEKRGSFEKIIDGNNISFENIWICKPRYPSFVLANILSAKSNAKLILDIDDNEEHMGLGDESKNTVYGNITQSICDKITSRIQSKSVASASLQKKYGGEILRHVRKPLDADELLALSTVVEKQNNQNDKSPTTEQNDYSTRIVIGFVGTARAHKGLEEVAKAIATYNAFVNQSNSEIVLEVCGHYIPGSLQNTLAQQGVITSGQVSMSQLDSKLSTFDAIVCGYPEVKTSPINEYQISSKVGDALRLGKPVLLPETPATYDLEKHSGIILFDRHDIFEKLDYLIKICGDKATFELPTEFTLEHGEKVFENLLATASTSDDSLKSLEFVSDSNAVDDQDSQKNKLLLIWKQQDAGLYGRRIDQIARSFLKANSDNEVHILEIMPKGNLSIFKKQQSGYGSDGSKILELFEKKKYTYDLNGVKHTTILHDGPSSIEDGIKDFQERYSLHASNTLVVYFPLIPCFQSVYKNFISFKSVVDIVDNQLSWDSKGKSNVLAKLQYQTLISKAEKLVFNSSANREEFISSNKFYIEKDKPVETIPNWYTLPRNISIESKRGSKQTFNVVYSGNMNDRIDWELLGKLSNKFANEISLHLVGVSTRSSEKLRELLMCDNVNYHGPRSESELISILKFADLAIVPHKVDEVSKFMNPLKVFMYEKIGLPIVSTELPGVSEEGGAVKICKSHDDFINAVGKSIDDSSVSHNRARMSRVNLHDEEKYLFVIDELFDITPNNSECLNEPSVDTNAEFQNMNSEIAA